MFQEHIKIAVRMPRGVILFSLFRIKNPLWLDNQWSFKQLVNIFQLTNTCDANLLQHFSLLQKVPTC